MTVLSKNIKVGDLVCCYRRNSQGIGIAIEVIEDFTEATKVDGERMLREINKVHDYSARFVLMDTIVYSSSKPDLVRKYFIYNRGFRKKLKNSFVYVKWLKLPSNNSYSSAPREDWLPREWLKAVK